MVKATGLAQPSTPATHTPKWTGSILLETVLTMAVTSVLLLTMGSATLLVSRVLPDAQSPAAASVAGATAVEQIAADLQYAISISSRSGSAIEFTAADRNGDGRPEATQ